MQSACMPLESPRGSYVGVPAEEFDIGKEEIIRQACVEGMNTAKSRVFGLRSPHILQAIFEGGGVGHEKGQTLVLQMDAVILH